MQPAAWLFWGYHCKVFSCIFILTVPLSPLGFPSSLVQGRLLPGSFVNLGNQNKVVCKKKLILIFHLQGPEKCMIKKYIPYLGTTLSFLKSTILKHQSNKRFAAMSKVERPCVHSICTSRDRHYREKRTIPQDHVDWPLCSSDTLLLRAQSSCSRRRLLICPRL